MKKRDKKSKNKTVACAPDSLCPERRHGGQTDCCPVILQTDNTIEQWGFARDPEALRGALDAYIDTRRCSLIGRAFDVKTTGSREECIEFLAGVVKFVDEYRR